MIIVVVSTKTELRTLPTQTIGMADIIICGGKTIKNVWVL